jgi:Holliday junction resolvase RusA-like endonuclease
MIKLDIKPLSVNEVWQGKRFKTPKYSLYEKNCIFLLPKIVIPPAPYKLSIEVGFSNSGSDIDNICKPFIDILQKKYLINDKDIFELNVKKFIVKKGCEYISFKLSEINLN